MIIKKMYDDYVVMLGSIIVAMGTLKECELWIRKAVA